MNTRRPVWMALAMGCSLTLTGGGVAPDLPPENERVEAMERVGGQRLTGRLTGDRAGGFRFRPEGGGNALELDPGGTIVFEGPPARMLTGLPPFHAQLGLDQQVSGRLEVVDGDTVRLEDGPGGRPLTLSRGGVQALLQRPGEARVLSEGFEDFDPGRWVEIGEPEIVAEPRLVGEGSLRVPAGGTSVTYRLPEPLPAGRLELAYFDSGVKAADQRWFIDLTFRGAGGPEPIRALLGWDDESLAVQSPQGPALAIQRLARRPGWHRLVVRFGPGGTELAVDGDELAHGGGPGGPLTEIRLASQTLGEAGIPTNLAAHLDDLSLAKLAEPAGSLEVDPTQDELQLISGDQLFGRLRSANLERIILDVDGRDTPIGWSEVAGMHFRRVPTQGKPVEGLLVRLEWNAGPGADPRDVDRLEGALAAVSESALLLDTPFAGTVSVPKDRARRLQVLGHGRRLVVDPSAHHLGNEVFNKDVKIDPPQPEGSVREVPFTLDRLVPGAAWLALDVVQVAGEAEHLPFSPLLKKGELRTNAQVNGRPIDYLNRHVESKNETPLRIRLAIPAGLLREGENRVRFEQVGTAKDPNYLDDLGLLCVALEFDASPPESPAAGKPGP